MNLEETGVLLSKVQAFDNRNVEAAHIIAWHEVLREKNLTDCLDAVVAYYARESAWMMPSHVMDHVKAVERDRYERFGDHPHLSDFEWGRCADYAAASKVLLRAVRTGHLDRPTYDRYLTSEQTIAEVLGSAKAIGQ